APIEQFELAGIPHIHAADRGAWALVAAVIIALSAGLYQAGASWRPIGLLLTASAVCPLLAARWGADLAVASALRWYSAGFFALASIGIWTMSRRLASDRWLESSRRPSSSGQLENNISDVLRQARDVLAALVVLIYVAMGAYVAQAAIYRAAMPRGYSWLWLYAGLWAVVVTVLALAIPRTIARKPNTFQVGTSRVATWLIGAREALLVVAFAPLAVLFTFAVARALDQYPIAGPLPASWFRRIGWDVSYSVPLAIIGLVFIGCAVRDRSSGFAFAAGLLFNAVATIVALLRLARGGGALDATAWIVVTQFNAIVCGIVALVWLAVIEWHRRRQIVPSPGAVQIHAHQHRWPLLLLTQVTSAAALCAMFLVPAVFRLVVAPADFTWAIAADGVLGWSAVALAIAAALWIAWGRAINVNRLGFPVAAVVVLVALTAAHWDSGNWLAYHTLLAGACAAAWLLPIAGVVTNRAVVGPASPEPIAWSAPAARLFGLAAVLLAAWGYLGDPASPWWTLAALMAITARAVWIAWCERRPGFVWIAAVLFLPAASIFWLNWASRFSSIAGTGGTGQVFEFVWINALAAALLALVGVTVTRRWMALHSVDVIWQKGIVFHRFAAWAIVVTLLLTTVEGLFADLRNQPIAVSIPLVWAAWLAALVAALACWWDPGVRWPVACLYCIGLIGVGIYLDGLNFAAPMFHWALSLALAAYSLATSALWSAREKLTAVAARWRLPAASTSGHGWLVSANIVLGVCVLVLVSWIETTMPEFGRRMFAAYAIGAQVFAIGLLARGAVRTSLQYLALIWGVFFAVAFAWAWLPPDFQAPWLHRLVLTVVALVAMVIVYGFGILKFVRGENEWTRAAAQLVPPLSAIAAALIMLVLAVEVSTYLRSPAGSVPIVMPAVVAVGLSLLALAIAALVAALVPGRDPLGLSERGRTLYVYAAEGLAGLLFLHIRVTMPWLFHGWFIQFWPLVVMGIAFVGVGFAELFERRQTRVLAEPLHNTGVLLPLLPAIGFWVVRSRVDYSLLLLSIGVLYTAVSVLRQSFWYAVLAALAANGSLWYWLHTREGFGLLEHPQMWLIPPALCALAAGYINRERLTAQQSAALRYAAAMVIYASSTADVFIQGVANAPWLPAVLAGLSILGVLAGIVLRVRAFLYLGTTFLVVALMTVIWHAAIHERHTWILWVAGIITGTLIIVMFGVFEKRRDDVLRVVEQLKQWEA
ncbi:MAG TPA: hypothetical protein VHK01_07285, partial [Lacipirellulaceae bacterium]|nr:hypothetical protein [Lacipirellulaceae bacterium]